MTGLTFRNVDAEPSDDVRSWPYEALVTAIDRGMVQDWRPIFREVRQSPWGRVSRRVEQHVAHRERDGVSVLFSSAIDRARTDADRADRTAVADRVRTAVKCSGLTQADFAAMVGTSASRLSTYLLGHVTPSAAMLLRIERTAAQTAAGG